MVLAELKRFAGLDALPAGALDTVAARARRLRVPSGRWLVRPGRRLPSLFFLLEGRIRLLEGGRSVIVSAGSARARRAVYPGVAGVETLTPAVFLSVDPDLLDAVAGPEAGEPPGVPEVNAGESSWQRRFLTSPLMQRLEPAAWQRILRAMTTEWYPSGTRVIRAGDAAACCYVLCSGRARIVTADGEETRAVLEPGSLFGEDALVSGRARNAHVVMARGGSVVSLSAEHFQSWLLDAVVRPLAAVGDRPVISLDPRDGRAVSCPTLNDIRHSGRTLSSGETYAIVGGAWPERTLAAFLLAEQGIDASPLR